MARGDHAVMFRQRFQIEAPGPGTQQISVKKEERRGLRIPEIHIMKNMVPDSNEPTMRMPAQPGGVLWLKGGVHIRTES